MQNRCQLLKNADKTLIYEWSQKYYITSSNLKLVYMLLSQEHIKDKENMKKNPTSEKIDMSKVDKAPGKNELNTITKESKEPKLVNEAIEEIKEFNINKESIKNEVSKEKAMSKENKELRATEMPEENEALDENELSKITEVQKGNQVPDENKQSGEKKALAEGIVQEGNEILYGKFVTKEDEGTQTSNTPEEEEVTTAASSPVATLLELEV